MLCRPHENLVTLHQWKLHGENRMQLFFDDDLLLLRLLSDSLYRCHQITDQCACVHSATSNWIPTTEPVQQLSAFLSCRRISVRSVEPESLARHTVTAVPGTPAVFPEPNFSKPLLNSFRCSQFRAACPRIAIAL